MTAGELLAQLARWAREDIEPELGLDAINDAIGSLWESEMAVALERFFSGPVNVSFGLAAERATITSLADPGAGTLTTQAIAGTSDLGARTMYAQATLVTDSGSETLSSPEVSQAQVGTSLQQWKVNFVDGAFGWNFYCGYASDRKVKQNDSPLPFGVFTAEEPQAGYSQEPDGVTPPLQNTTGDNIAYIRTLEVQNPDTTWTRHRQADLDSLLFERAARSLAPATSYAQYAYDLLKGRTLEIRPAAGQGFTARHFFVERARRIAFERANLPFESPGEQAFLKDFALAKLMVSLHEYPAARAWSDLAESGRARIRDSLLMARWSKNERITPFL